MRRKFKLMVMTIMFFIIISIILPCSMNSNTYARSEMDICETDYIPEAKVEMGVYVPDAEVEFVETASPIKEKPTRQKPKIEKKKDIRKLVEEEVRSRLNSEVLFFTAGRYGDYGTPMFRVENHYFSK